jgi:hypothetical protein
MALTLKVVARVHETGLKLLYTLPLDVSAGQLRQLVAEDIETDVENIVISHEGKRIFNSLGLNGSLIFRFVSCCLLTL